MKWIFRFAFCLMGWWVCQTSTANQNKEEQGREFIASLNNLTSTWSRKMAIAKWNEESNLTDFNTKIRQSVANEYLEWKQKQLKNFISYPWQSFKDLDLRRQFKKYAELGMAALPRSKWLKFGKIKADMMHIYSTTKLVEWQQTDPKCKNSCQYRKKPTIRLDPDLLTIFSTNINDSCKLQYYWEGWHGTVGRKLRPLFEEYVNLKNQAAKVNNFTDNAEMWISNYEMDDFEEIVRKLYEQILPLYKQLHAYVRRRVNCPSIVECKPMDEFGFIPAHILGDVWAQQWGAIYERTIPIPLLVHLDVTSVMKAKNFTALTMFKLAEEFFVSLNLSAMTNTFWNKSIIEKPIDREMVCHASAWNFYDGEDYRIKMCTKITARDFKTIHHEMGHIQYYQQYQNQPHIFRDGANPGFHEAVGDTIALSVVSLNHLIKIGLLHPAFLIEHKEAEINFLYMMALEKVAFLPYAYVLDVWRWEVFRGKITPSEYNSRYWKLREDLQGIKAPVDRSEKDFDAGAKFHVVADVPYIRYFVSFIIQFQFHKALCIKAGQFDPSNPNLKPLHRCDIHQSTEAGNLLKEMLQMGSSKPWQDAFQKITGQREMDAGPLLEYFQPLMDWLKKENENNGDEIGWHRTHRMNYCENMIFPSEQKKERKSINDKCHYYFPEEKPQKSKKSGIVVGAFKKPSTQKKVAHHYHSRRKHKQE